MTPHFTLDEFTVSNEGTRRGINNDLPLGLYSEAKLTLEMMERIRRFLSELCGGSTPIVITSGYRNTKINSLVGGKANSDHTRAQAVDFIVPRMKSAYDVSLVLAQNIDKLDIGQVIYEFGRWTHVSRPRPSKTVNRILTYKFGHPQPFAGIVA